MLLSSTARRTNPIARAEQRRLQRESAYTRLPVLRYAFMLAVLLNLLLFLCVTLQEMIAGLLALSTQAFSHAIRDIVDVDALLTGALLFVTHAVTIAQGLQVASSTIAHEKQARTWEMVLLTGIDARRIVYGKWLAAMTSIWSVHRPLLVWRAAALILLCAILLQVELSASPQPIAVVLAPALLLVYSIVGVSAATTIGLVASVIMSGEGSAYRLAMALHLLYIVASLLIFFAIAVSLPQFPAALACTLLAPFDAGLTCTTTMLNTFTSPLMIGIQAVVSALYAVLCAGLSAALLRISERLAVFQRAIPRA
jgi:ABC-type Na+ efflux pump permease subunit